MSAFEFTSDWFSSRIPVWEKHLVPHLAGRPVDLLEIGSYEGRSAVWTLQHLATDPASSLTCLDLWAQASLRERFERNIAAVGETSRVRAITGDAAAVLRWLSVPGRDRIAPQFDHVYIDADHRGHSKVELAVLAWPLLRRNGLLTWDDYARPRQSHDPGEGTAPKLGIDAFCALWAHELEIVHTGWQRIVRKGG